MTEYTFTRKRDGSYQVDSYEGISPVLDIPSQFDGKTLYAGDNVDIKAILERLAICEHLRWNASHIALGYIHGDKKDSIKRTHPCIQDFKDIDTYTQYYDWLVIKTTLKIYADENS